jgi:membrane protein YdbS with pleckstrin-like domain
MEERKLLLRTKPNYNILYEMFMPTGRRVRNTFIILVIAIICYFFLVIVLNDTDTAKIKIIEENNLDIFGIFNIISIFIISVFAIKLIAHLVIQIWQYNSIRYSFYDDYMEYEDTFLNQHKKTLRYDNIKEIEIRRTIWDRINGYGMVIIYTNAERDKDNGLILYSIKDPENVYSKIDEIIHNKSCIKKEDIIETENISPVVEKEESFKESLNNKE